MKVSSSVFTVFPPRMGALLNDKAYEGLMALNRSQVTTLHILRFWVASVNKFNNNIALF